MVDKTKIGALEPAIELLKKRFAPGCNGDSCPFRDKSKPAMTCGGCSCFTRVDNSKKSGALFAVVREAMGVIKKGETKEKND